LQRTALPALADEASSASRREFTTMHGVVSALLLAILLLTALKPT
jgi:hypothetical protein